MSVQTNVTFNHYIPNLPYGKNCFLQTPLYKVSVAEGLGYSSRYQFIYKLEGKSKSERMRFYYALYGRNKEGGVLQKLHAEKYTDTVILCPVEHSEEMREFLNYWKIEFKAVSILLTTRAIA